MSLKCSGRLTFVSPEFTAPLTAVRAEETVGAVSERGITFVAPAPPGRAGKLVLVDEVRNWLSPMAVELKPPWKGSWKPMLLPGSSVRKVEVTVPREA